MRRLEKVVILALLAWLSLGWPAGAADTGTVAKKRVLVIVLSDPVLPLTSEIIQRLRTNLGSASSDPVELNIEFADRLRYTDAAYLQKFVDLLQYKYSQPPMDVVIGLGDEAASIIDEYGEALFGTIPMISYTINPRFQKDSTVKPHLKNLVYGFDVLGQVLLIEQLLPETRRVFVVSGSSQTDREGAKLFRKSLRNYQGSLKFIDLIDITKAALLAEVARLPEHSVVLYLSFIRDAAGNAFISRDVMSEIAKTANVPVFSFLEIYLGHGIVGGYLLSAGDQGKRLAEVALQLLHGDAPAAIDAAPLENRLEFDWRQLQRWGIDEARLPPGSVVRFKEASFWDRYRKYIIGIALVIFLQSALVFVLVAERVRRRRAEVHLAQRLAFEEMLSGLSARFVDLPPERVDVQIAVELTALGQGLQVDRITLFELSETDHQMVMVHSYAGAGVGPPPAQIEFDRFSWAREKILQGQSFHFSDPADLPPEAAAEMAFLQSQGIRSAVVIPVAIEEKTRGMLALSMVTRPRQWSPEMIRRYEMVAQVIAHALARKRSDDALLQSKHFTRQILDSLSYHIAVLDRQGTILDVNQSWERFARENDAASKAPVGPGVDYLEVCRRSAQNGDASAQAALEGIESVLDGSRELFVLEYPCHAPEEKRWFIMRVIPFSGRKGGVVISHIDNTRQKMSEIDLRKAYADIEKLKNQLEAETAYLREEIRLEHDYEGIIGQSAAIQYVLYKVEQVAATDTSVLVQGETGTGKELVCRAIHSHSLRSKRPLVKVNCAALPANLIENELFGHERGAFSGASERRIGRFELADKGTIFLDEVGELPLEVQGKLLRVLEDGEFERLGSSMTTRVDARVIAATNRDLEKQVREGGFREDLYYRLGVFPITVPPLRERKEDIALLTRYFVEHFAKRLGKTIQFISEDMLNQLQAYRWPGNVRELKNVIERAVINCAEPKLRLADDLSLTAAEIDGEPLKCLQEVESDYIVQVLEKTSWRIDGPRGAAVILKINPSTLRSRMRKLGIKKSGMVS